MYQCGLENFSVIVSCNVEAGASHCQGRWRKKNKANLKRHKLIQSIKTLHGIA